MRFSIVATQSTYFVPESLTAARAFCTVAGSAGATYGTKIAKSTLAIRPYAHAAATLSRGRGLERQGQ